MRAFNRAIAVAAALLVALVVQQVAASVFGVEYAWTVHNSNDLSYDYRDLGSMVQIILIVGSICLLSGWLFLVLMEYFSRKKNIPLRAWAVVAGLSGLISSRATNEVPFLIVLAGLILTLVGGVIAALHRWIQKPMTVWTIYSLAVASLWLAYTFLLLTEEMPTDTLIALLAIQLSMNGTFILLMRRTEKALPTVEEVSS